MRFLADESVGRRIREEVLGFDRAGSGERIVASPWRQLDWSHFRELVPLRGSVATANALTPVA
ncbi:MAG: hypothetical protein HYU75_07560 [Betaproteobacteria bacterium]|nr:hypothetical protein [Betaproteobacteria bacterium]